MALLENNVTGAVFLELDKDELKEIVKQIGTVKQLQSIQSQQKKPKVHMYLARTLHNFLTE